GFLTAGAGFLIARAPGLSILGGIVFFLGLAFAAFCLYFFRDPNRPWPTDAGLLYSPGDGTVLSVTHDGPGDELCVRIFLSLFNVHVQRAPCSGLVEKVDHIPGSFVAAMKEGAKANERCVMTLRADHGGLKVIVEQIAGLVARRIECWPSPGAALKAGERYGIIYFGSQAALRLPGSARALVKPGDKVQGGVTPLAQWTR
ncbi:MAG: phosphatidylserine decarboxylase, partial [Elusimicrobia bacterium]|nr:phosphatidylserine decarboxylase [Elusimicrobiota bacterium]